MDSNNSYLIIGLGNPGREYKNNRHNVGFMQIDRLAETLGIRFSRLESKALVTKVDSNGKRVILAKPQTFMNLSGQSVGSLLNYYKIPLSQMLVTYDEIDLPFGTLRLRARGGSAGHNGMHSIIERLGTQDFSRLRIGVNRPPGRMEAAAYVLQDFSSAEQEMLDQLLERGVEAIQLFISDGIEAAMNQFNGLIVDEDN